MQRLQKKPQRLIPPIKTETRGFDQRKMRRGAADGIQG